MLLLYNRSNGLVDLGESRIRPNQSNYYKSIKNMNHKNKILRNLFLSGSKIIRASSFVFIAAALIVGGFFSPSSALAATTVNPASGGANISIDTTSAPGGTATFKTLTGPSFATENGDIDVGTHTISLPTGWEFDVASTITITPFNDIEFSSTAITPGVTSFTFEVISKSTSAGSIGFSGLKVRPTGTTPSNGNMTYSGAGIVGVSESTNFGTLSTVPGTVAKLAFATQPGGAEYGSLLNPQPVVKTQDQFGNDSTKNLAASLEVGLTITSGTGALIGDATLDIGTGAGNGTVTFTDLTVDEFGTGKQLTAAATGLASAVSNDFEITKKSLTATLTADNKVYDGLTSATITGVDLVGLVDGDIVGADFSAATATFEDENADTEKAVNATGITLTGGDKDNYTYDGTAVGTADITPKPITVTADPKSKTYGDADPGFTYQLTGDLVDGDTLAGSLSRDAGENVGAYAITQGDLDNGNYGITFVSADLTINQRAITVTAVTNTKVYDGDTTSVAVPTITDGSLAFSDTAGFTQTYDDKNVDTGKTLTPSGTVNDGNGGNNYVVTFANNATGVITEKELTVSGLSVADKVYDGNTDANISGTPALVGVEELDDVSLTGTAAGEFNTANVGVNTIDISGFSLTGDDSGNYTLTQPVLSAEITAKPISVTPDAEQSKVYGDADPTFAYTSDSLIGDDEFTGSLNRVAGEVVDTYAYTLGILSAGSNYSLTLVPGTFEITPKTLTVSAIGVDKVYNANEIAEAVLSGDVVEGDEVTFGYSATFSDKNVADGKVVSVSEISITGGEDAGNYTLGNTTAETTADITPAPLTATITASDKVYDGNTSATITGRTLDGVIEGDIVVANEDGTAAFADKNVGDGKTVSAIGITIDGVDASNYSYDGTAAGTADITPATLTVSATGVNKVYNGNTNAEAILSGDTIGEDEVTFGYTANFTDKNVGEDKTVNVSTISITGGDDADNYILGNTETDTTADITPAALTATITASDKVYDGNTSATITGRTLDGVVLGDDVTVNEDGTATFDTKDVGVDKAVSAVDITIAGSDAGNYSYDGTAAGTADITSLEITVTPDADQSKVYGDADPIFAYTSDSLIGGDEFTGALSRVEGENVGAYEYELGSLTAGGNYELVLDAEADTFEINQRAITVTAVTNTKVYDGDTTSVAVPTITDGSLAFSDTAGFTQTYDNKNVGENKTLTPSGEVNDGNNGDNYNVTFANDETGVITEKELTVSGLSAAGKTYDGTTAADVSGTPALVGVEGADDVSLTGVAEGEFNTANAGAVQVEIVSLSLTGGDASNYTLTQPVLEAEILPLEITGSFTTENKVYDGNTAATVLTQSLGGVLPGDEGNVVLTGGAADFADANVANDITVTASEMTLSGSAAGNYTLTSVDTATANITQLEIVITPDAGQSKVYGQLDPTFAYANTPALIGEDAFSGDLSRVEGENVGTYEYELGSLTAGGNYSLTLETETFEIVKATPVITWENPADIVYGTALSGTELNATADVDGTFVYTPVLGTVLNAGDEQELSVTFTPDDADNYSVVEQTVVINVTPAPLTVTADDKSKDYGTSDPALTYTHSELVNGDTDAIFSGSLTRDSGEDVGEYDINQGTLSAGSNYEITYNAGTLTIEDTVAPTIVSHTPSLNALNISPTTAIVVTFSEAVDVESGDVSFSPTISGGFTISNSGTSVVTITPNNTLADNTTYTITLAGVADINGNPLPTYSNIKFTTATNYSINLNANGSGWNLISLPVVPSNTAIATVLGSAADDIDAVWTYDPTNPNAVNGWLVFVPGNPEGTNNLTLMTTGFGYWVSVTGNANLSGSGTLLIPGNTSLPSRKLQTGWNLIGYYQLPNENTSTPVNAFASIGAPGVGYNGLWGFDNTTGFFNSVTAINPGDAFWIALPSTNPNAQYFPSNILEE
jgi:trimeric autotransporter adhesin